MASVLIQYHDFLRSIHETVSTELQDNKNAEFLTKMFAFRRSSKKEEQEEEEEVYM